MGKKNLTWILGASAGVLVLAGGLCAILLSGNTPAITPAVQQATIAPKDLEVSLPQVDELQQQHQAEIDAITLRTTMLPGTAILGVNVGGMTKDEAKAALSTAALSAAQQANLQFRDGTKVYPCTAEGIEEAAKNNTASVIEEEDEDEVDPEMMAAEEAAAEEEEAETGAAASNDIGIRLVFDVDEAIDTAFGLMRDRTLDYDSFMAQVQQIAAGYDVAARPQYDKDSVTGFVAFLANAIDTPAKNATLSMENNAIVYVDEVNGRGVDQTALVNTILATDPTSGTVIDIPMTELTAPITKQMLQGQYTMRGPGFSTSFSGSTSNRKYNIRFGAEKINGTVLKPGEVFSANQTLGKRTKANGWKSAGAYEGGEVVQQAGGGVCQLSSTLYNAVLMADLKIVERRNHSMPVHYVDKGRDATINSVGNEIDFKFENDTDGDIIIIAFTSGNTLTMQIYGLPMDTEEYDEIRIRTKRTGTTAIEDKITYDDTKPVTYRKVDKKGSTGYTYRTYKEFYKNGKLVNSIDLGVSTYRMFPNEVTEGTLVVEESTPAPENTPAVTPKPESTPAVTPKPESTPCRRAGAKHPFCHQDPHAGTDGKSS